MTPRLKKSVAGEARWPTCHHVDDYCGKNDDCEHGDEANDGNHDLPDDDYGNHVQIKVLMTYLTVLAMCNFRSHEPNSATKSTVNMMVGMIIFDNFDNRRGG